MTPHDPDASVTHLGGGRSARWTAIAVAVALVGVVWVGWSGRPPAQPDVPPPALDEAEVAEAPIQTPEPSLAIQRGQVQTLAPDSSPTATRRPVPALPYDMFGVAVFIGLRGYHSVLDETEPGHLTGTIDMPLPLPEAEEEAELVFMQFSAPWAPGRPVQIGQWPISLRRFNVLSDRIKLVVNTAVSPEDAAKTQTPRPARDGYWIRAGLHTESGMGTVEIDVRVGPSQQLIALDDGLFGPRGNEPAR